MTIVGIGSQMRVGKDCAAQGLCRDLSFKRIGFADSLKDLAMIADPLAQSSSMAVNVNIGHGRLAWMVQGMGWETAKDSYPEVRSFLQKLGDGCRQVFGKDIFVRQVLDQIKPGDNVVIPDVRFPDEAEAIKAAGGLLIRIDRPGFGTRGSHLSETALEGYDGWDVVYKNDTTIHDLQTGIVAWVQSQLRNPDAVPAAR